MITINTLPPEVISGFDIEGAYIESQPYGSGHINDTFLTVFQQGKRRTRYVIQRINQHVFSDPVSLMENIRRVTGEQQRKLADSGLGDRSRRALQIVTTRAGAACLVTSEPGYWRCYRFIEGARSYDVIRGPEQAFAAAKAFRIFGEQVAGIPSGELHVTIPGFHHTRSRFERLLQVTRAATPESSSRLERAATEWAFIREREDLTDVLLDLCAKGALPERVTHNDTKLNNVLIDDATGEGLCVIDLDTVMPGLTLYDFGDLVRSAASGSAEDETGSAGTEVQMPLFEALVKGYLSSDHAPLNEMEKAHLVFSGKLIALETAIRFLTDYLEGNVYFKTAYSDQNLDRCRKQLALVGSIEAQETTMKRIVDRV